MATSFMYVYYTLNRDNKTTITNQYIPCKAEDVKTNIEKQRAISSSSYI